MMASIFSRVSAETNGDLFSTRETVFFETCANRAMSLMVGRSGNADRSSKLAASAAPPDPSPGVPTSALATAEALPAGEALATELRLAAVAGGAGAALSELGVAEAPPGVEALAAELRLAEVPAGARAALSELGVAEAPPGVEALAAELRLAEVPAGARAALSGLG